MDINKHPAEPTFDILGLTLEEASFLRDLLGHFSCVPDSPSYHLHTNMFHNLVSAVGSSFDDDNKYVYEFPALLTNYENVDYKSGPHNTASFRCNKVKPLS